MNALFKVEYVNAHGTSTKKNDQFETIAYKAAFGDHARKLKISSIKVATFIMTVNISLIPFIIIIVVVFITITINIFIIIVIIIIVIFIFPNLFLFFFIGL